MRVLLARVLAVEAAILLADEAIAALDPLHQLEIMDLLWRTAHQGRGVVVVLHDLALAARFCDRLVLLANRRILAEGLPSLVLTDEHVAVAYGVEVVRVQREGVSYLLPWVATPDRSKQNCGDHLVSVSACEVASTSEVHKVTQDQYEWRKS